MLKADYFGVNPYREHQFVKALRKALPEDVERFASVRGTILALWLGEDAIMCGEKERSGNPVKEVWPGVCEWKPSI